MPMFFSIFQVVSREPFLTLENAAKASASAADVHDFAAYNQLSHDTSDWATHGPLAAGTITIADGDVTVSSGEKVMQVRSFDRSVRFVASGTAGFEGVVFKSGDGTTFESYVVGFDDIDFTLWELNGASYVRQSYSTVQATPSGNHRYEIFFTERRFGSMSDEYWITASLYMDDKLIDTLIDVRTTSMAAYPFHYVGFRTGTTYNDVHISGASEVADPLTVDPGEAPASGLSRTIDGLHLKLMLRFDESVYVFRAVRGPNSPAGWTVEKGDVVPGQIEYARDMTQIKPHVRVVGAYVESDYVNTEWAERLGDRFTLINNPFLLTLAAVRDEARASFLRMLEAYLRAAFTVQFNPFIEPEDDMEVDGERYIVSGFNVTWAQNEVSQSFEVRHNPYEP